MKYFLFISVLLFAYGCQTAPKQKIAGESTQEVVSALGAVTQGLTNKDISQEDLKRLAVQVQRDPQAKSALEAVNASFNVKDTGVKYCPVDGKRYSSRLEFCPDHKTKLLPVE